MKILIAHPAQQHSYRLATALYRKNILFKYITTVYWKKGNQTALVSKFLKGTAKEKAKSRYMEEVPDSEIVQFCEVEGLLKLLTMHMPSLAKYYNKIKYFTADRFAKKVANYAIKYQVDAVITYDDTSPLLFEILKEKAPNIKRILDMSAANLNYMRTIYDKDAQLAPEFSRRLHKERAIVWSDEIMDRALREIRSSEYFLVPSNFVKRSLLYSGCEEKNMIICPYGVDTNQFSGKTFYPVGKGRPIRFVYVGGVKELKGIFYLLEAFLKIPTDQAILTVVGSCNKNDQDIQPYLGHVEFTGPVLHKQVSKILNNSDVFVFPSLGEGLSLSTLEAAACGLPIIVTENSGVNDLVKEGREGFIIPIQSESAIRDKVEWFIKNPEKIEKMGRAAHDMALEYTWERYYKIVAEQLESVVKQGNKH